MGRKSDEFNNFDLHKKRKKETRGCANRDIMGQWEKLKRWRKKERGGGMKLLAMNQLGRGSVATIIIIHMCKFGFHRAPWGAPEELCVAWRMLGTEHRRKLDVPPHPFPSYPTASNAQGMLCPAHPGAGRRQGPGGTLKAGLGH